MKTLFKKFLILIKGPAQTITEYAIVIALVISAILAMQIYIRRGLQARYRAGSRLVIDQMRRATGNSNLQYQYEPYYLNSEFNVTEGSNYQQNLFGRLSIERGYRQVTNRTGAQYTAPGSAAR